MQLGFLGYLVIYILLLVFMYIYTVVTRKKQKDDGRFSTVKDAYRREARAEFLSACRERVQDGEVAYLSIDDLQVIVNDLKEKVK